VGHSVVVYRFPTFLCAFVHFLRHFHDPIISNQRKKETKDKKTMRKRIEKEKKPTVSSVSANFCCRTTRQHMETSWIYMPKSIKFSRIQWDFLSLSFPTQIAMYKYLL
jgi:hypothetical protein